MFFQLVSILLAIVPDHGNEYTTKENKNWTSFPNFATKLHLNHNIYNSSLAVKNIKKGSIACGMLKYTDEDEWSQQCNGNSTAEIFSYDNQFKQM